MTIAENLALVNEKITAISTAHKIDRPTLIAVGKNHPIAAMEQACVCGQRDFGENRVHEAAQKWPDLKKRFSNITLHLIGSLQSNKVRPAVELFDVIHTLDREKLARRLADEARRLADEARRPADEARRPVDQEAHGCRFPRLFVQVNTGEEKQKSGIAPARLAEFIEWLRHDLDLVPEGLMAIPPLDEEPALHFALLGKLARKVGVDALSMGMSGDFTTAIRFGARYLRVGTAIFGRRPLNR